MTRIRVVLADDHAVVRKGIRQFLEDDSDIEVLAEAGDGEAVKALIRDLRPDVAILDVRMPHATGIEVTAWLRTQNLPTRVLILSAYDDDPFVIAALQAGASGYVLKTSEADDIIDTVRAIHAGRSVIPAALAQKLARRGDPHSADNAEHLTDREHEVLEYAAAGMTNRAIGFRLSISDRTVQGHLASIYAKLNVNSRTEAVTKALQLHLISLPENKL